MTAFDNGLGWGRASAVMGRLASKRQLQSETGHLQVQGRPVGRYKWSREDVAKSMERHVYESGWCLASDAPMKHRQSSFRSIVDALGIPEESLRDEALH